MTTAVRVPRRQRRASRRAGAAVLAAPSRTGQVAWLNVLTPSRVLAGGALILALVLPLVNYAATFESFELPKQVSLHIGIHVTLALALAALALRLAAAETAEPAGSPGEGVTERVLGGLRAAATWPPLIAYGLIMVAWTGATAFSVAPTVSFWGTWPRWAGWWQQLHVVALFPIAAASLTSLRRVRWLAVLVAGAAAVSAGYALFQRLFQNIGRPHSTFGNPNFLSDYVAMSLPLTLAAAVAARSKTARALWLGSAVLQLGAVVATQTRGVWVALAGGLPLLAILLIRQRRGPWLRVAVAIGAAGVVAVGLLYAFRAPLGQVPGLARVVSIFEARDESAVSRLVVWNTARQLWLDRPILGHGPDAFGTVSGRRLPPQNEAILSESTQELFDRAHNTTLDGLAAVGVVGMATLWATALLVVWCGYRLLRETDLPSGATLPGGDLADSERAGEAALARHPLSVGIVAGLAAYAVAQLFSIESAGASALAWTLGGVVAGSGLRLSRSGLFGLAAGPSPAAPARRAPAATPPVWAMAGAGLLAVAVAAVSGLWEMRAVWGSMEFKRANGLARAERSAEATAAYEQSAALWPFERRTWLELGFARRHNARVLTEPAAVRKWLLDAVDAGDRAVAIDPENPLYLSKWADLAGEAAQRLNDTALAERALKAHERALALAPDRWVLWGDAGLTYLRLGRVREARDALQKTVTLYQWDWVQFARLGDALAALNDKPGARRAYERALAILAQQKQDHQGVRESLARLGPE